MNYRIKHSTNRHQHGQKPMLLPSNYNQPSLLLSMLLLLFLTGSATAATSIDNCQQHIYGCASCLEKSKAWRPYYTCKQCQSGLYLYKHLITSGTAEGEYHNICVRDCQEHDPSTFPDEVNQQCVYLGPYCSMKGLVPSSVTSKPTPTCHSTNFEDGFVRASRGSSIFGILAATALPAGRFAVSSIDELRKLAHPYFPPLAHDDYNFGTPTAVEANAKVMMPCYDQRCRKCNAGNPLQCYYCWATVRADAAPEFDAGLAECPAAKDPTQCPAYGGATQLNNCHTASSSCYQCADCNDGYALDAFRGCFECQSIHEKCLRCHIDGCEGCNDLYTNLKTCVQCADGYGIYDRSCRQCTQNVTNMKSCWWDASQQEFVKECKDGFQVSEDGKHCQAHCQPGQYITYSIERYYYHGLKDIGCQPCHSSCKTCAGAGEDRCTSCYSNQFIKEPDTHSAWGGAPAVKLNRGKCESKVRYSGSAFKVLVKGLIDDPEMSGLTLSSADSLADSFDGVESDLLAAIYKAYELSSAYNDTSVEIVMETGTHIINQAHFEQYQSNLVSNTDVDAQNPLVKLTIRPFDCADHPSASATPADYRCRSPQTESGRTDRQKSVRVVSKIGAYLVFKVPRALTVQGIHFDAVDSVQAQATDAMKSSLVQSCTRASPSSLPTCADSSVPVILNTDPICRFRPGASLFQFANIQRDISTKEDIPKLSIVDSSFSNFLYDMGSLIRLPQRGDQSPSNFATLPYDLEVKGSRFEGLGFCGSIISNDYPTFENGTDYMRLISDTEQRFIKERFTQGATQTVLPGAAAYRIVFENNTVVSQNTAHLASAGTLFQQRVPIQMQKLGLALHLVRYPGSLSISSNTFTDTKMAFSDVCSYRRSPSASAFTHQSAPYDWEANFNASEGQKGVGLEASEDTYQLHSLIVIDQQGVTPNGTIKLDKNQFRNNLLSSSLVSIEAPTRKYGQIEVTENVFETVQSYLSPIITMTLSGTEPANDDIAVDENEFTNIYSSCQQKEASLLTIQRNQTSDAPSYQNQVRQITSYCGGQDGTVSFKKNKIDNAALPNVDKGHLIAIKDFLVVTIIENTIQNVKSQELLIDLQFLDKSAASAGSSRTTAGAVSLLGMKDATHHFLNSNSVKDISIWEDSLSMVDAYSCQAPRLNSFVITGNSQFSNINASGLLLVSSDQLTTLSVSGLSIEQITTASFQLASSRLTTETVTIEDSVINDVSATREFKLLSQLLKNASSPLTISLSNVTISNTASPSLQLFQGDQSTASELTIGASKFQNLAGTTVSLVEGGNAASKVAIVQSSIEDVTMQGSQAFALVKGSVGAVDFNASSVSTVSGGAELYKGEGAGTQIRVDGGTFQHFKGNSEGKDLIGWHAESVTIANSIFSNITDLEVDLIQGDRVDVNSSTFQQISGRTVKVLNAAKTVSVESSVFKEIANVQRFISGGSSALSIENVTASNLVLTSDISELLMIRSEDNSVANSGFDEIRGPETFNLATINFLQSTQNGQNAKSSFFNTTYTNVCIKSSSEICSASDDTNVYAIVIKHPTLSVDQLQVHELSIKECSLSNTGSLIFYGESTSASSFVNLGLQLSIDSVRVSHSFLGLQNVALQSLQVQNVKLTNSATLLKTLQGITTDLAMFELNGQNVKGQFYIKDIDIDFGQTSFDYAGRLKQLEGLEDISVQDGALFTFFKVDNFPNTSLPILIENIKVSNLNMTELGKQQAGSINRFRFLEVDSGSRIEMKKISISKVESTSNGVIMKQKSGQSSQQTAQQAVGLDLAELTVDKVISLKGTTGGLFDLSLDRQTMNIGDSSFQEIYGEASTIVHGVMANAVLNIKNTRITKSVAKTGVSFGSLKAQSRSTVAIEGCTFESNTVLLGSSLLQVESDVVLSILASSFIDNKAANGTHGILVMPDKDVAGSVVQQPEITIKSSSFDFKDRPDAQAPNVRGGYIQIRQIDGKYFSPVLSIWNTTFRMGSALQGGAIYYGLPDGEAKKPEFLQSLTLKARESTFIYNKAQESGGAVYLNDLNLYDVTFEAVTFSENSAGTSADNIFAKQTQRIGPTSSRRRMLLSARRLSSSGPTTSVGAQKRGLEIKDSEFVASSPKNAIYVEGLESLTLSGSILKATQTGGSEARALEGAGVYAKNVYAMKMENVEIESMAAKVRGGALMIKQDNETFFGQSLEPDASGEPRYVLEGNSFKGCSAQQGGALFLSGVRSLALRGDNVFTANEAVRYSVIPPEATNEEIEPIASRTLLGQGPALFTDCHSGSTCAITVAEGTVFGKNDVVDAATGETVESGSKVFAVGEPPAISAAGASVDAYVAPKVEGARFFLMTDTAEIEELKKELARKGAALDWTATTILEVENDADSPFRQAFNLDSFESGSQLSSSRNQLFGDSALFAIADESKRVQTSDEQSTITFECNQTILNSNYRAADLPRPSRCLLGSGASFVSHTLPVRNGIVPVPEIYIESLPNTSVYVNIMVKHVNTDPVLVFASSVLLRVDMVKCGDDQVINTTGLCQSCPGPSLYKRLPGPNTVPGRVVLEDCQACPDDIFRCDGGSKVTTLAGYQRLSPNTDEYARCPRQGTVQPCLEGDECIEGHEGVLCATCQSGYFMNSEGRCLKCGGNTNFARSFLWVILYWVLFIIVVIAFVNILATNQSINRLSSGTYLMKSIINYAIYIAILSEVFSKYWVHADPEKQNGVAKAVNELFAAARSIYTFPLMVTIEMAQCRMLTEKTGNGVQVRGNGAYYAGAVLLSLLFIFFFLKLFKSMEQRKERGAVLGQAELTKEEKPTAVFNVPERDSCRSSISRLVPNADSASPKLPRGAGREGNASQGSNRSDLAKINPSSQSKNKQNNKNKEQIRSTIDRIGGQEAVSDFVAHALQMKDGRAPSKDDKAHILAESYEHLRVLKERKLKLQQELTQYQEEVNLENLQQHSVIISDDQNGLLPDGDLPDAKKSAWTVDQDGDKLQNLSQDQPPRRSFEMEGGEYEVGKPHRNNGKFPASATSQEFMKGRVDATGSARREFTTAKNGPQIIGNSDQLRPVPDQEEEKGMSDDSEQEELHRDRQHPDYQQDQDLRRLTDGSAGHANMQDFNNHADDSRKPAQHQNPPNLKMRQGKSGTSQDPENVAPNFAKQKMEPGDKLDKGQTGPDQTKAQRNPGGLSRFLKQIFGTNSNAENRQMQHDGEPQQSESNTKGLSRQVVHQSLQAADTKTLTLSRNQNKQVPENMAPGDLSAQGSARSGAATNYPVGGVGDGDYHSNYNLGPPEQVAINVGELWKEAHPQDRLAQRLRGNSHPNSRPIDFGIEDPIEPKGSNINMHRRSPIPPERQNALQTDLRKNGQAIDQTTEQTLPDRHDLQRRLRMEPHFDEVQIENDYEMVDAPAPALAQNNILAMQKQSAAEMSQQDDNDSLHNHSEDIDFKELSRNLQNQLFNQHKFEKLTLFMMIVHFLLNIQVIELIITVQSCRRLDLETFKGQQYSGAGTFPVGKWLNSFDSSFECADSISSPAFVFTVVYCAFWTLVVPIYSLLKAWRLYLIESFGMIAKVLLLAVAKVLSKVDETQSVFLALLVVSVQLITFLVLCQRQTLSQTEKLTKLNTLNAVDLVLYVALEVTCIIGVLDHLVEPEPGSATEHVLMVSLLLASCLYLLTWAAVSVRMFVSYTYQSPKLAWLLLFCSCGCIVHESTEQGQGPGGTADDGRPKGQKRSLQDLENRVADQLKGRRLAEQEQEKEMQRLDVVIKHLENQQKKIGAGKLDSAAFAPAGYSKRPVSDDASLRAGMAASSNGKRDASEQIIMQVHELLQVHDVRKERAPGSAHGLRSFDIEQMREQEGASNGGRASPNGGPATRGRRNNGIARNTKVQAYSPDASQRVIARVNGSPQADSRQSSMRELREAVDRYDATNQKGQNSKMMGANHLGNVDGGLGEINHIARKRALGPTGEGDIDGERAFTGAEARNRPPMVGVSNIEPGSNQQAHRNMGYNDTFSKMAGLAKAIKIEGSPSGQALRPVNGKPMRQENAVLSPLAPAAERPQTPTGSSMDGAAESHRRSGQALAKPGSEKNLRSAARDSPKSSRSHLERSVSEIISNLNAINYPSQAAKPAGPDPAAADHSQLGPQTKAARLRVEGGWAQVNDASQDAPEPASESLESGLSDRAPARSANNQGIYLFDREFAEERGGRAAANAHGPMAPSGLNAKVFAGAGAEIGGPGNQLASVMNQMNDLQSQLQGRALNVSGLQQDTDTVAEGGVNSVSYGAPVPLVEGIEAQNTEADPDHTVPRGLDHFQMFGPDVRGTPFMEYGASGCHPGPTSSRTKPIVPGTETQYVLPQTVAPLNRPQRIQHEGQNPLQEISAQPYDSSFPIGSKHNQPSSNHRNHSNDVARRQRRGASHQSSQSRPSSEALSSQGADEPHDYVQTSKKDKQQRLMQAYTSLTNSELSVIKKKQIKDNQGNKNRSKSLAVGKTAQEGNSGSENERREPGAKAKRQPDKQRKSTDELKQKMQMIKELKAREKLLKERESKLFS